jgi:predicted component of type VI protein secretion system
MKEIEYVLLNNNINFEIKDFNIFEKKTKKQSQRKIPVIAIKNSFFPIKLKVYEEYDLKFSKKNFLNTRGLNFNQLEDFNPDTISVKI